MKGYSYERDLQRLFVVAINDMTIIHGLTTEEKAEFRQLRYRFGKGEVGETTMRKIVEKYLNKKIIIVDK